MKKEKKVLRSIIAVIIVIGVFCISFVVRSRKFHSDRMGYSKVSQTGSDTDAGQKGNFGDTGVESGEGGSFAGEDAPPKDVESGEGNSLAGDNAASEEEEASQRINMEKAEREVKLKKQETDIKPLDDKTKAKLLDSVLDGKPEVVLKCKDVKAPDRMKRYKRVKLDVYSEDARKKLELLFGKAMQDNPNHTAYSLNWLNDIDGENKEENPGGENDAAKRITSAEAPYWAEVSDPSFFSLEKQYYDTRIRTRDCFSLTRKYAVNKTKAFLEDLITTFGLGCGIAPQDAWKIGGAGHIYENDVYEQYYEMEVGCTLDGYVMMGDAGDSRIKSGNFFVLQYSESGWRSVKGRIGYSFEDTGKYYENILSLEKARDRLLGTLKKRAKRNEVCAFGATSAQLGYAVIGKEVRPVWILYGEVKKMGGSGNGYVLDAVTGETLWDMPNV